MIRIVLPATLVVASLFLTSCGTTVEPQNNDTANAVAVAAGGAVIVAGESWNGSSLDMVVWRYTATGALDTTFGDDDTSDLDPATRLGFTVQRGTAGADRNDTASGVALDGSGNIVVVGSSNNGNNIDMVLWRFNPAGVLDTTFGDDDTSDLDPATRLGYAVSNNPAGAASAGNDLGNAVVIDGAGNIIITGSTHNGSNLDMVVWRFTPAGVLDTGFGTGGIVVADNPRAAATAGDDSGQALVVDGTDILVAGYSYSGTQQEMAIWRYDTNGNPDTTFGEVAVAPARTGYRLVDAGFGGGDKGMGVALDGTDILVAGNTWNGASTDMVLWRFDVAGDAVTGFGTSGVVISNNAIGGPGYTDDVTGITISGTDVLVSGFASNGYDLDMVLWRVDASGAYVSGFGTNGIAVFDNAAGGKGQDVGRAVSLDGTNIIVAGNSSNGNDLDMTVWKMDAFGVLDPTFDGDGVSVHNQAAM